MANQVSGVDIDTGIAPAKSSTQDIVQAIRHLDIYSQPKKIQKANRLDGSDPTYSLYTWPAEVRILLYEAIANTTIEPDNLDWKCSDKYEKVLGYPRIGSSMTRHVWDLPQRPFQQPARPGFEQLQLVDLQFHREFLATWAESTVHHIHPPIEFFRWPQGRHFGQRVPETIKQIAHQLSAALKEWLENIDRRFRVARRIRHVVLCFKLISRTSVQPAREIYRFVGQHVARYFEALPTGLVHPRICVEVAIVCVHVFDGLSGCGQGLSGRCKRARRRFVLKLAPPLWDTKESGGAAWACVSESPVEERKFSALNGKDMASYEWVTVDTAKTA